MEQINKETPKWVKAQQYSQNFRVIRVPKWDDWKDWVQDNGCYVLIRIYSDTKEVGVAICDYHHVILMEFRGQRLQDIYNFIFKYNRENKKGWFTRFDHAAYLGKELQRAWQALELGMEYCQE
ncbi:MAG TPA: DUF4346 domain-containing protein [Candidatus Paceibacterota bacterium]